MPTQRIPLFGSYVNRNDASDLGRDQRFVNCYPELITNPLKKSGQINLYKRPGFSTTTNAAAGYAGVSGRCVWTGFSGGAKALFCYISGTNLRVYDTSGNLIGGTIANISGECRLTETKISGVAYLTIVARTTTPDTRNHAWFMAEGAGAWTLIADVDYPSNTPAIDTVGKMVHMNGRGFIMDVRGTIWQSAINDLVNWSAIEFIDAQESPDAGSGLEVVGNLVAAFGATTTEFFQYTGAATGSALTRIPGAKRIGAISGGYQGSENIITVGDSCIFMSIAADSGQLGVHRLVGTSMDKISTNTIDRLLASSFVSFSAALGIAGVLEMHGMQHLVLMTKTTTSYCYCLDTKQWWLLSNPGIIRACASIGGRAYFVTDSTGTPVGDEIWSTNPGSTTFQDSGTTLTMTILTAGLDQETRKRKLYTAAELVCDTQTTSGDISLSWSDDDCATFSTARALDPSAGSIRRVTGLGSTKKAYNHRRAWKIEETVNRPFRATELVLEYEVAEA